VVEIFILSNIWKDKNNKWVIFKGK